MDWVWVLIGCLLFVFGLMIFLGGQQKAQDFDATVSHKDGLPLTPRHARQIVRPNTSADPNLPQDALSQLASVVHLHKEPTQATPQESQQQTQQQTPQSVLDHQQPYADTMASPLADAQTKAVEAEVCQETNTALQDDGVWQEKPLHAHFDEKKPTSIRNHDALYDCKKTITLTLTPRSLVLEGRTILDLVRQYALRFGDRNMFHRYENPKGEGMLWFSVLGMTKDGLVPFDLAALPDMQYRGLAFFVALPNPQALRGFDSMVQVAQSIAQSVDADIHTEDGYLLNDYELKKMRYVVEIY